MYLNINRPMYEEGSIIHDIINYIINIDVV